MSSQRRRHKSVRRAVSNVLSRIGFHATARDVVQELARFGIHVSEGLVSRVRIDELKARFRRPEHLRCPISKPRNMLPRYQKIPQKRPWRGG